MNGKAIRKVWLIIGLWLVGMNLALAYYNPAQGRWLNRDPINETGFRFQSHDWRAIDRKEEKNAYCFLSNEPQARWDYLGLSGGDVLKLFAIFRDVFSEMCKNCNRCNFPHLGNIISNVPGNAMQGCTEQAINLHKRVDDERPKYEADWEFAASYKPAFEGGGLGPHNWVTAESDDPNDPSIEMDTWKGCFSVSFSTLPSASWKACFACPQSPQAGRPDAFSRFLDSLARRLAPFYP